MSHTMLTDHSEAANGDGDNDGAIAPAGPSIELMLDGDLPRLATEPSAAPPPELRHQTGDLEGTIVMPDDAPVLPLISPVLTAPGIQAVPSGDQTDDDTTSPTTEQTDATENGQAEHPMAHLMPVKSLPTEASRRAAEQRAIKKAKAKKIKIGVAAGALVFSAVVGPPLGKWLVDAINDAGDTTPAEEIVG
jgi:hypothetical protein